MPIPFVCSGCSFKTNVKDELAGKKIKCPKCGTPGVIAALAGDANGELALDDLMKVNLNKYQDVAPEEGMKADGTAIDPVKKKKKKKKSSVQSVDSSVQGAAFAFSVVSLGIIAFLVMNIGPVVMEAVKPKEVSAPEAAANK